MSLYTKFGDKGRTMLYGGDTMEKDNTRMHAIGSVDELNSILGVILSCDVHMPWSERLTTLQHMLFTVGSDLATPMDSRVRVSRVNEEHVRSIELWIDEAVASTPPLTMFILPGGSRSGSFLHQARTVCRRAERWIVALSKAKEVNPKILIFMNRLGDLLFALARVVNKEADVVEVQVQSQV